MQIFINENGYILIDGLLDCGYEHNGSLSLNERDELFIKDGETSTLVTLPKWLAESIRKSCRENQARAKV